MYLLLMMLLLLYDRIMLICVIDVYLFHAVTNSSSNSWTTLRDCLHLPRKCAGCAPNPACTPNYGHTLDLL
jgi:hypothetical protein